MSSEREGSEERGPQSEAVPPPVPEATDPRRPTGTVTFLVADFPLEKGSESLRRQVERSVVANGGVLFERGPDLWGAAFDSAVAAMATAHAGMGAAPTVRMALHTGVVAGSSGEYVGRPLAWVRQLLAAAHPGQLLLSRVTQELVRDQLPDGVTLRRLQSYRLGESQQPELLFEGLQRGDQPPFPPLNPPARRPGNLRLPPTPLVGRAADLDAVLSMLGRDEVRLVTLTGPGGVGKSRLALEAALHLQPGYPDGAFQVDLSPLSDPGQVVPAILQGLGVTEDGGRPLQEQLVEFLAPRTLLLVLDSFETVRPAALGLAELLAAAPGLSLLVTSRAGLQLAGNHAYEVTPLALPPAGQRLRWAQAMEYEAVEFFVQRIRAVDPAFRMNHLSVGAVMAICRQLDGLPLALELAAVWARYYPVHNLQRNLELRLFVLNDYSEDRPARHQTMRNTIEWSYQHLQPEEQMLLCELAVFDGGVTLDMAVDVFEVDVAGSGWLFPRLSALVNQSLLRQERGRDGELRFRMLDTIREFAREKAAQQSVLADTRRIHAYVFLRLAQEMERELWGPEMRRRLDRLEAEYANLLGALYWAHSEAGEAALGGRLAALLVNFWEVRHRREGRLWLEAALVASPPVPPPVRAQVLRGAGVLARTSYDRAGAEERLEQSLALYRELGDERGETVALTDLGVVLATLGGDRGRARRLLTSGLERYRRLGITQGMSWALYGLGWVALRDALADREGGAWALSELDVVAQPPSALDEARDWFEQSLQLRREGGESYHVAWALAAVALVAAVQGDHESAMRLTRERLAIEKALDNPYGIAAALQQLGTLHLRRGEHTAARALLSEGLALARERQDRLVTGLILLNLGELLHAVDEPVRAASLLEEAAATFRHVEDGARQARVLAWRARLALERGEEAAAHQLAARCVALAQQVGSPETVVACLSGLGDAAASRGQATHAAELWGAAADHLDRSGTTLIPVPPAGHKQWRTQVRTTLGDEAFRAAIAQGEGRPLESLLGAVAERDVASRAAATARPAPARPAGLTPRQYEVLRLVGQGLSNREIAARLVVNETTVKAHLTAAYRKLGVSSRTAAVRYLIDHHLT